MFDEIRDLHLAINNKRERIEELRWQACSTSMPLGEKVQTSPTDRMSEIMCKIILLENELESMENEYSELTGEAITKIYSIGNSEWSDILYTHYIEFKTLQEIADNKGVSLTAIRLRNNRALKKYKLVDETK